MGSKGINMSCYCGDCPQCNGTLHKTTGKSSKVSPLAKTEPMRAAAIPLNVKSLISFISDFPREWKALSVSVRDKITESPQEFVVQNRDDDSLKLLPPDIIFRGLCIRWFGTHEQWIIHSIIG